MSFDSEEQDCIQFRSKGKPYLLIKELRAGSLSSRAPALSERLAAAAAAAKSLQSCPTLRDPMDCSPPGPSIHGIFQARVLEWGAIAFSEGWPGGCLIEIWTAGRGGGGVLARLTQMHWPGRQIAVPAGSSVFAHGPLPLPPY